MIIVLETSLQISFFELLVCVPSFQFEIDLATTKILRFD